MPATTEDLRRVVEEELDAFVARDRTPGVVVGVVHDDALVLVASRGTTRLAGTDRPAGSAPDELTVFRIASMTKSFTAATVLSLRDEGVLRLDDPVARWLPGLGNPAPWGAPLTLRHLLTMGGGLPTDDPWGDRQQDLPVAELDALAAGGFSSIAPPGAAFEYSNLGYALLGRVVTESTGQEFSSVVAARVLRPLGLASTGFAADALPDPSRLAVGYVPRGEGPGATWDVEPPAPHGAFSPMGGLFSCVRDLARWVAGFLAAEAERPDDHPLAAASRREMSRTQRFAGLSLTERPGQVATAAAAGYALGLVEEHSTEVGRLVHHSGGYPGFGSHMRWHPASGLGVIALGNRTYAPMRTLTAAILARLVTDAPTPTWRPSARAVAERTDEAVAAVTTLLTDWDDAVADRWFADNMDRDVPRELRRQQVRDAMRVVGTLGAGAEHDPADRTSAADGPAYRSWWVQGATGRLRAELLMSPQRPSLVQYWSLTAVPEPGPALTAVADALVASVNGRGGWPDDVPPDPSVDLAAFDRAARWLESRCGAVTRGSVVSGDGERAATWRLASHASPRAAELRVELSADEPGTVTLVRLSMPTSTVE